MKILIIGGAGFIGSHIVDLLIEKGYDIVVIDDLSKGNITNVNKKAKFYKIDILSKDLAYIFGKENFSAVIHQAAKTNVRKSLDKPIEYAETNILGTLNLLECCRKFNVKRFIYAASASRYGPPQYLPCGENHIVNPLSPYALSKYAAETYLKLYAQTYGITYTILIYSNVYGERQNTSEESGVIPIFITKLLNKVQPSIFGNGEQTRDFTYVEDVAFANYLALTSKNAENKTFNVCYGEETSINALYEKVKKILAVNIEPIYKPKIKGEIEKIYLSNQLIEKELGWRPNTRIDEGLRKTIEYYKKLQ